MLRSCGCAGIEDMRVRRDEVQRQIQAEEEDKGRLQQEISVLTKQLAQLNSSLARKVWIVGSSC